jgi:hypothetical protein
MIIDICLLDKRWSKGCVVKSEFCHGCSKEHDICKYYAWCNPEVHTWSKCNALQDKCPAKFWCFTRSEE